MFKLKVKETDYILKSFDAMELWRFIISNEGLTFDFYLGYQEISVDDFLNLFLHKTKNWREYYDLYQILKTKPKSIIEIYG